MFVTRCMIAFLMHYISGYHRIENAYLLLGLGQICTQVVTGFRQEPGRNTSLQYWNHALPRTTHNVGRTDKWRDSM